MFSVSKLVSTKRSHGPIAKEFNSIWTIKEYNIKLSKNMDNIKYLRIVDIENKPEWFV